jgi:hypothetical protein
MFALLVGTGPDHQAQPMLRRYCTRLYANSNVESLKSSSAGVMISRKRKVIQSLMRKWRRPQMMG